MVDFATKVKKAMKAFPLLQYPAASIELCEENERVMTVLASFNDGTRESSDRTMDLV